MKVKNATKSKLIIYAGRETAPEPDEILYLDPQDEGEMDGTNMKRIVINQNDN